MSMPLNLIWEPTEVQCEEIRLDTGRMFQIGKNLQMRNQALGKSYFFLSWLSQRKGIRLYPEVAFPRGQKARASDL